VAKELKGPITRLDREWICRVWSTNVVTAGARLMSTNFTEAEMVAKQRKIFNRERQLEIEQAALNAAIEERGYDGANLMYRAYYETPKAT
jgi:hypothetical protein